MKKTDKPRKTSTPAAELTARIADSLEQYPEDSITQDGNRPALERIEAYPYWNAFDKDRPK